MAKCDLTIELEEPDRTYHGGDRVRGTVLVRTDNTVNCSGLELESVWETHGRGNVARGTPFQQTVYSGTWQPGEYRYDFELEVSRWPPTYHGHYLNVEHYVRARAKVPWSFDPKASVPIRVISLDGPDVITPPKATQLSHIIGFFIMAVFGIAFLGFGIACVLNPFMLLSFGGIALIFAGFWFFFKWLPKWKLGKVDYHLDQQQVTAGEDVTGTLSIQPRSSLNINQITLNLSALEQCESGSGSNRKTHRHVLFEVTEPLAAATTIPPGKKTTYSFRLQIPDTAAPSLDLDDNQLAWAVQADVDIPRWPDWREEKTFCVVPPITRGTGQTNSRSSGPAPNQISFAEAAELIWSVHHDPEQVERVVAAVTGLPLEFECVVLRRLLTSGDHTSHAYAGGTIVQARFPHPELLLTLYVPYQRTEEFHELAGHTWRGIGTVVGFDFESQHLQIRIPLSDRASLP